MVLVLHYTTLNCTILSGAKKLIPKTFSPTTTRHLWMLSSTFQLLDDMLVALHLDMVAIRNLFFWSGSPHRMIANLMRTFWALFLCRVIISPPETRLFRKRTRSLYILLSMCSNGGHVFLYIDLYAFSIPNNNLTVFMYLALSQMLSLLFSFLISLPSSWVCCDGCCCCT